jgi:hypothetical protein
MPTPSSIAITGLPAAGAVTSGNVLPLVQVGVTTKAQVSGLVAGLPATSSSAGIMSASDKAKLDAATSSNTASTSCSAVRAAISPPARSRPRQ